MSHGLISNGWAVIRKLQGECIRMRLFFYFSFAFNSLQMIKLLCQ